MEKLAAALGMDRVCDAALDNEACHTGPIQRAEDPLVTELV